MGSSVLTAEDKRFLKRLGSRIRQLRIQKGWTLEEVEAHGWKGWQHLQKIESGKNITVVTLCRVAKLYEVTVSALVKNL